jgi:hypothetical protein
MKKMLRTAWLSFALITGLYLTVVGFYAAISCIALIVQFPIMRAENTDELAGALMAFALGVLLLREYNGARRRYKSDTVKADKSSPA